MATANVTRMAVALMATTLLATACIQTREENSAAPTAKNSISPTPQRDSPLEFVLDEEYQAGTRIAVKLRNTSSRSYVYNPFYEACDMAFFDSSGRRFIIPPGTHCDLVARERITPGDTVTLFRWRLTECLKDEWGCAKAEPLSEGVYTMRGWFRDARGGKRVVVEEGFRVVHA
jgi:hypothetical protein